MLKFSNYFILEKQVCFLVPLIWLKLQLPKPLCTSGEVRSCCLFNKSQWRATSQFKWIFWGLHWIPKTHVLYSFWNPLCIIYICEAVVWLCSHFAAVHQLQSYLWCSKTKNGLKLKLQVGHCAPLYYLVKFCVVLWGIGCRFGDFGGVFWPFWSLYKRVLLRCSDMKLLEMK